MRAGIRRPGIARGMRGDTRRPTVCRQGGRVIPIARPWCNICSYAPPLTLPLLLLSPQSSGRTPSPLAFSLARSGASVTNQCFIRLLAAWRLFLVAWPSTSHKSDPSTLSLQPISPSHPYHPSLTTACPRPYRLSDSPSHAQHLFIRPPPPVSSTMVQIRQLTTQSASSKSCGCLAQSAC